MPLNYTVPYDVPYSSPSTCVARTLVPQVVAYDEQQQPKGCVNGVAIRVADTVYIVTVASFTIDAMGFKAVFKPKNKPDVSVLDLMLVKAPKPPFHNQFDLAVFQLQEKLPFLPRFFPVAGMSLSSVMAPVVARDQEGVLRLRTGVACGATGNYHLTTALTDEGFAGAPVVDAIGNFVGMVTRASVSTGQPTRFLTASAVRIFACTGSPPVPLFPGIYDVEL
ncbi:hypothetical protein JKP88DRAFT_335302 [Tribonema minus]|uniref:Uncharacterized protein n=1 Tax=Tribonema minus TaxID=303371 RepID=A0A835YMU3_9STRA|nr:hypothetical protein JKP88DRAFT_335302 [Tribonema minus]